MFIDVGHYITDIDAYKDMLHYINNSTVRPGDQLKINLIFHFGVAPACFTANMFCLPLCSSLFLFVPIHSTLLQSKSQKFILSLSSSRVSKRQIKAKLSIFT